MRNKPFVFFLLLLSAPCAPARPDAPASAATDTRPGRAPEEVVREFYEWYLGELRGGREPFKDEERMRQYVTDDFIRERAGGPPDLDPVFGLAKSDADLAPDEVRGGEAEILQRRDVRRQGLRGRDDEGAHRRERLYGPVNRRAATD
jgi:hypothetical protein